MLHRFLGHTQVMKFQFKNQPSSYAEDNNFLNARVYGLRCIVIKYEQKVSARFGDLGLESFVLCECVIMFCSALKTQPCHVEELF
jgi:hypothetical protein